MLCFVKLCLISSRVQYSSIVSGSRINLRYYIDPKMTLFQFSHPHQCDGIRAPIWDDHIKPYTGWNFLKLSDQIIRNFLELSDQIIRTTAGSDSSAVRTTTYLKTLGNLAQLAKHLSA